MRHRTALICTTLAALAAPATASAQFGGDPVEGITVSGVGRVEVHEPARQTERAVQRAVDVAQRAALPLALADARRKASELSELTGVPLGGVFSVLEGGFGGGSFEYFGPDGYCREIPARPARGRRNAQRARTECRVPESATASVFVTYRRG